MTTASLPPRFLSKEAVRLLLIFSLLLVLPLVDRALPQSMRFAELLRPIFIYAILAAGLNVVTGYTGMLHLGMAAFMSIGAYTYAILTCAVYPFQVGFWPAALASLGTGAVAGAVLGLPTLRLRGDYIAIVTLGFGEIVQDTLKNLDSITKGTQGLNPLPSPSFPGIEFTVTNYLPSYYLYLALLALVIVLCRNLQNSHVGRSWFAINQDDLAARCMGINVVRTRLLAFALGAGLASFAGALFASYLQTSGEPSIYDFQLSIIVLCVVIVGGMGSLPGIVLGAIVMMGLNSIVLVKLSELFVRSGWISSTSLFAPNNWKLLIYGLALILMMRWRPKGIIPFEPPSPEPPRPTPTKGVAA